MPLPGQETQAQRRLGPYVLGESLGGGGMGDVFLATHVLMKTRRVAVKILKPHLVGQPYLLKRFLREIAAVGGVKSHPNLVRAEFADLADDVPYLVMEYVGGIDLGRYLKRRGPLPIPDACEIIRQAAHGLAAIHEAGFVHRDLKPSNLMLTRDGVIKILDLGLARLQMIESPADELTNTNCFLGTSDYTAPEQAEDPRSVDIRADIYSLGCTVYKLLSGQAPYAEHASTAQKIRAHAAAPFPNWPASVSPALEAVFAKMVAKDRAERYATPLELAAALAPFALGNSLKTPEHAESIDVSMQLRIDTPANAAESVSTPPNGELATVTLPRSPLASPSRRRSGKRALLAMVGAFLIFAIAITSAVMMMATRRNDPDDRGEAGKREVANPEVGKPDHGNNLDKNTPRDLGDPHDVDHLEPMKWHPLLHCEPTTLVWSKSDKTGHTKFNENPSSFFVTNNERAYFQLGVTQKRNYKIQVTLNTHAWDRVGVFFGYRTPKMDPAIPFEDFARLQYITFAREGQSPILERGRTILQPTREGRPLRALGTPLATIPLTEKAGERVLEVAVTEQRGVRVFLDNVDLTSLHEAASTQAIPNEDFRGIFGVFTHNNSCHFRDAKVYLFASSN